MRLLHTRSLLPLASPLPLPTIVTVMGQTPLHFASEQGRPAIVRQLLAAGAQPGATDANGLTPVVMAARQRHTEVAALLVEAARTAA